MVAVQSSFPRTPAPPISRKKRPIKHGAYINSPDALRVQGGRVARLVRMMRQAMPWLKEQDSPTCRAWAELEVIGSALFAAIMQGGAIHTADGDVFARRVVNDHRQNRLAKLTLERELGYRPAN
jgi:hypothetical protein